jgi:hypothetical protein
MVKSNVLIGWGMAAFGANPADTPAIDGYEELPQSDR